MKRGGGLNEGLTKRRERTRCRRAAFVWFVGLGVCAGRKARRRVMEASASLCTCWTFQHCACAMYVVHVGPSLEHGSLKGGSLRSVCVGCKSFYDPVRCNTRTSEAR